MTTMRIKAGARLNFTIERASADAESATFIAVNGDGDTITDTVDYVDGVAEFQFDSPDTDIVGTYDYQINENFATGSPDKYPSGDDCDGDECEYPQLEICESLDDGAS